MKNIRLKILCILDCLKDFWIKIRNILLLLLAQGRGIADYSLPYCINQVFSKNLATKAFLDPNPKNKKAWNLYDKLGFKSKARPEFLQEYETYLEITKDA